MNPKDYYDLINSGGALALLVLIIFVLLTGLYRGWWVPGPFYQELKLKNQKLETTNDTYEEHFKSIIEVQEKQREELKAQHDDHDRSMTEIREALRALRPDDSAPPPRPPRSTR